MPTYRKLYTKTIDSFDFNELPNEFARVCWLLLPLILDCEGRGIYNPAWIRSKMFPLREDVNLSDVKETFECFVDRKMIVVYEVNGKSYFYIPSWKTYQTGTEREAKSLLPSPQELVESKSREDQAVVKVAASASASVYESVNESVNAFGNGNKQPATSYARIFSKVTGMVTIPGDPARVMDAIDGFMLQNKNDEQAVIDYLLPYWDAWGKQKTKDGRKFSRTNTAWLTDWAVAGDMPEKKETWDDSWLKKIYMEQVSSGEGGTL